MTWIDFLTFERIELVAFAVREVLVYFMMRLYLLPSSRASLFRSYEINYKWNLKKNPSNSESFTDGTEIEYCR